MNFTDIFILSGAVLFFMMFGWLINRIKKMAP